MERAKIIKRKNALRNKRKLRVRAKINGTATLPRLSVTKSNRYFYAQAIDDTNGVTLVHSDGNKLNLKSTKEDAAKLAVDMATKLKDKSIDEVVFDRNGYIYHGVVKAFADALRENGIKV